MDEAFYLPSGDGYISSEHTRGPWDPHFQHGGPPAALLAREIEGTDPQKGWRVVRITFEILKPIPVAEVAVHARLVRPGRSVEYLEGVLMSGGTEILKTSAWRMRPESTEAERTDSFGAKPPASPNEAERQDFFAIGRATGYHAAVEWKFTKGGFASHGPATCWMRMRHPLLPGETPSPLTRVLVAADSGNGISSVLDFNNYVFINTDLTVHFLRPAEGEWVCLDAATSISASGTGLAETTLWDERGRIGRSTQSLFVSRRSGDA